MNRKILYSFWFQIKKLAELMFHFLIYENSDAVERIRLQKSISQQYNRSSIIKIIQKQTKPNSKIPSKQFFIVTKLQYDRSTDLQLISIFNKQVNNSKLMQGTEEGFLVYDTEWIELSEQQLLNNRFYKSKAIFNPITAADLDPKDPNLLNQMFEPYIFEHEGKFFRLNVSPNQTSRKELDLLENLFQQRLQEKQARKSGICPIREQLHNQLFDEIIRQATINLPERGILLMKIRDHLKMTFAAYQTLYEGSLVFGNRKAHVAEQGISQLQEKLEKLRKKKVELENKKILYQTELQSVVQSFKQINEIEEKAQNEEIAYLNNQTKRLEDYLNELYGD